MQSYNFTQPAADAIPLHGAAQGLLDAPAKTTDFETIGAKKNGELAARTTAPIAIHRVIFNAAQQTAFAWEPERGSVKRA